MNLRTKCHIALLFIFCGFSCSDIQYYHHSSDIIDAFTELKLHKDGTYEEYHYIRSTCSFGSNHGYVLTGRYHYKGDTLFLTAQNWQFNESDSSYYKTDRRILSAYFVDGPRLIDCSKLYNPISAISDLPGETLYSGKCPQLRLVEIKDSVTWDVYTNEEGHAQTIHNYRSVSYK